MDRDSGLNLHFRELRERAEAGVLLPSDEITKAKHGIAVQRERTRPSLVSNLVQKIAPCKLPL